MREDALGKISNATKYWTPHGKIVLFIRRETPDDTELFLLAPLWRSISGNAEIETIDSRERLTFLPYSKVAQRSLLSIKPIRIIDNFLIKKTKYAKTKLLKISTNHS